jgi:hypothetical protein
LAALEVGVIAGYGILALSIGLPPILNEPHRELSRWGPDDPVGGRLFLPIAITLIGGLALASVAVRALAPFVFISALIHSGIMIFVAPLWVRAWLMVGGEPPVPPYMIPVHCVLPIATAYLLASSEPRGARIQRLLDFRPRLTWGERTILGLGIVAAFLLVYIGGRFVQLLFVVYILGPAIGVAILIGFIIGRFRERRRRIPNVGRHIKLRSTRTRPSQRRHYWTISEEPPPADDED